MREGALVSGLRVGGRRAADWFLICGCGINVDGEKGDRRSWGGLFNTISRRFWLTNVFHDLDGLRTMLGDPRHSKGDFVSGVEPGDEAFYFEEVVAHAKGDEGVGFNATRGWFRPLCETEGNRHIERFEGNIIAFTQFIINEILSGPRINQSKTVH